MRPMKRTFFLSCLCLIVALCKAQQPQDVHLRKGLPNIFKKLSTQSEATIVFFGGSITNHPGYRVYVTNWLQQQYPKCKINSVNAGVGGTASGLGVFRMDDDVLAKKPDLVFVEFAVNDGNTDSLTLIHTMEGIVRKIWKQNLNTDICFLYTAGFGQLSDLNHGRFPHAAKVMEVVANHYQIPTIHMGFVVAQMVRDGKIDFKGTKSAVNAKPFFSDDGTHPTIDFGHHIYADTIIGMLKRIQRMKPVIRKCLPEVLDPDNQQNARTYAITVAKMSGGWKLLTPDNPMSKQYADKFMSIATANDENSKLTITFKGTQIGFYDVLCPTSGKLKAVIDNGEPIYITRFDIYCIYSRANNFMLPLLKYGVHTVVISPDSSPLDKISILKRRHTENEIGDVLKYIPQNIYLGKILVLGDLVK
jgi:lysophospholipase L1-like esterase